MDDGWGDIKRWRREQGYRGGLTRFNTFGTSMKKLENSASFDVAPHYNTDQLRIP